MIATILTSGSDFFNADQGGNSELFQHVIWFLGHPEFWLSILILLINLGVLFALCRQSHNGKAVSAIWLGAILYTAITKFHYFKTMEPLTSPQIALINFMHFGINIVAIFGGLWVAAKSIKRHKHSKGHSKP